MRQEIFLPVLETPIYSRSGMGASVQNIDGEPTAFSLEVGNRLKHLREDVRKMSPEDVEREVSVLGGNASASYIRRVEKGINNPTIEKLHYILRALGSNLGEFFEYHIEESKDESVLDRQQHRILQRSLEQQRTDTIAVMRVLSRQLK